MNELELSNEDIYRVNGPLDLTVLFSCRTIRRFIPRTTI